MSFAAHYLQRYSNHTTGIVTSTPDQNTALIVTIPSYKEEKLLYALESLRNCNLPAAVCEVIVLINYPAADASESFHRTQYQYIVKWSKKYSCSSLRFYPVLLALPPDRAGVGLARKILMDEAVIRFHKIDKPNGIIIGYDADCRCETNYLQEIYHYFCNNSHHNTCSIYFEHPLEGDEYGFDYDAIAMYELYLRYYVEGLRFAGLPMAFHTIGSAFAVRADAYVKQGGMNRRKAGEDFYFLNKMMLLGGYGELNTTVVYPSPRLSDRVPFGTGAALRKIIGGSQEYIYTWNPEVFRILKDFYASLPSLFCSNATPAYHPLMTEFLTQNHWLDALKLAKENSSQQQTFLKRIFQWFDGLKVLQFIRFAHSHHFPRVRLKDACRELLEHDVSIVDNPDIRQLLYMYRNKQKGNTLFFDWK